MRPEVLIRTAGRDLGHDAVLPERGNMQDQESDHREDDQCDDRRTAERRQIEQHRLDPRRPERPRRVRRAAEGEDDPAIEGQRFSLGDFARQLQEDEQQDAAAQADEEPRELAAFETREPPAPCGARFRG